MEVFLKHPLINMCFLSRTLNTPKVGPLLFKVFISTVFVIEFGYTVNVLMPYTS